MDKPNWYPAGKLAEPFVPQDISDAKMVFPADVSHLMPPVESIPEEFGSFNAAPTAKKGPGHWIDFQSEWFFKGLDTKKLKVKKGIDKDVALRHLSAIQGSFEPKHEYKSAAVAFLASLWFEDWK